MGKLFLSLLVVFCIGIKGFSQNSDFRLAELLNKQNYFQLKAEYPKLEKSTGEFMQLLSKAYIGTYFNQPESSNKSIQQLLSKYCGQMQPEVQIDLANLMADNFVKLQEYEPAISVYEQLSTQLKSDGWNDTLLSGFRNVCELYNVLKGQPKQEISFSKNTVKIPLKKDTLGLLTLPVSSEKESFNFILDFGAGTSMIPARQAEALGIKIIADSMFVPTIAGTKTFPKLGIANEINIGGIQLKNVIFYVVSDEIFPQQVKDSLQYDIEGIIGMPVLRAMQHLCIKGNKELIVSQKRKKSKKSSNIMQYGNTLFVKAVLPNDSSLLMQFDSGGALSSLSKRYLSKGFENEQDLIADSIGWAGYASIQKLFIYKKENFQCTIGSKKISFPTINIIREDISMSSLPVDGVVGLDVLSQYKETIIDFTNMYIDFK